MEIDPVHEIIFPYLPLFPLVSHRVSQHVCGLTDLFKNNLLDLSVSPAYSFYSPTGSIWIHLPSPVPDGPRVSLHLYIHKLILLFYSRIWIWCKFIHIYPMFIYRLWAFFHRNYLLFSFFADNKPCFFQTLPGWITTDYPDSVLGWFKLCQASEIIRA